MAASLNDWRFQGYLYKMVLVCFWAMKAFLSFKVGERELRGFCGSLITTYFLERIFFRHFYGVVQ